MSRGELQAISPLK